MNKPFFLTKDAFNLVLADLLEIEEGKKEIIDKFFREPSREAEEMRMILNNYVKRLDDTIKNVTISETAANDFPYVIIGSEVVVKESGAGETYCYKLISPLKNRVDPHEISFLSPMGKSLLFKEVNDDFIVEAPGGNYKYQVLSIRINTGSINSKFAKNDE